MASRVRARASAAPMTLEEAEEAGLVDVMNEPNQTVFVTTASKPITVTVAGRGTVQVTPITGEGSEGTARVYDVTPAGIAINAQKPRRYTKPMRVARHATVRYWSVDVWGNREKARVAR